MIEVKQSTAFDDLFFAHDANGDAVTGMVDGGFTKRISKDAAVFGAMTVTITERENGWYHFQLSASHSDTLGLLTITFTNASCKQVNLQYRVTARIKDDLAYPTTSGRSLDVTTTGAAGIDWGNVENQGTTVDLSATDIQLCDTVTTYTGNTLQTGDSFARLGAPAGASVSADVAAVKAETAAIVIDTQDIQAQIGTAGAGLTDLGGMSTGMQAEVESEVNDALVAQKLDHLVAVTDADDPVDNSIIAKLAASDGDWSGFMSGTDALEAIRDRGDLAWLTGGGGGATKSYTTTNWTRTVGDDDGGTGSDTLSVNGVYFATGEISTGNYLEVDAVFTLDDATETARELDVWGFYNGGANHSIQVQVLDTVASTYEPVGVMGLEGAVNKHSFELSPNHTNSSTGIVTVKFLHQGVGVPTHVFNIDKAQVNSSVPSTTAAKLLAYIQLITRSDAAIEADNATELGEINADEGSGAGDYSSQTDSQEALNALINGVPTVAEFNARTLVAASYFDPTADTVANVTTVGSVTTKTGYSLTASERTSIADVVLARDISNAEPTGDEHTLRLMVLMALEANLVDNVGFITIYQTDGATEVVQKAVTTDASADPVTGVA